jgi:hypothetical protein
MGRESGDSLAARDLGVERETVRAAQKYAALPEEVKEKARLFRHCRGLREP